MTLAEHNALLKEEGRYDTVQALHRQREEEVKARSAEWRRAEELLVNGLAARGFMVHSVWDLVNVNKSYSDAIPVLIEHLQKPYPDRVREGIARALAVPEAHEGWAVILGEVIRETDADTHGTKWALACALGASASDDNLEDVLRLIREPSLGRNRAPLVQALARSREARAQEALESLRDDVDVGAEVTATLRSRRSKKTRTKILKH